MSRPSVKDRARRFVEKARPSIAGQHGHDALFAVACALAVGFAGGSGLTDADQWELLCLYNAQSCQPSWADKDLERKLKEARKQAERHPEKVGELITQDAPNYTGPRLMSPKPTGAKASGASAKKLAQTPPRGNPADSDARTHRTPLFEVVPFGVRAKHGRAPTLRTLPVYSNPYTISSRVRDRDRKEPSEKSENPSPAPVATPPTAAAPKSEASTGNLPAAGAIKPKAPPAQPAEKVDKFTDYKDGRRFRKRHGEKGWTRLDKEKPSDAGRAPHAVTVRGTPVRESACPACWRYGKAIPMKDGTCLKCGHGAAKP